MNSTDQITARARWVVLLFVLGWMAMDLHRVAGLLERIAAK